MGLIIPSGPLPASPRPGQQARDEYGVPVIWQDGAWRTMSSEGPPIASEGIPHVEVYATSNAGQVVTGDTEPIQYEDEVIDTHNAWDFDEFVCPVAGCYAFAATADPNSATAVQSIFASINGVFYFRGASHASGYTTFVAGTVWLEVGDVLQFRYTANSTRDTSVSTNTMRIMMIARKAAT